MHNITLTPHEIGTLVLLHVSVEQIINTGRLTHDILEEFQALSPHLSKIIYRETGGISL